MGRALPVNRKAVGVRRRVRGEEVYDPVSVRTRLATPRIGVRVNQKADAAPASATKPDRPKAELKFPVARTR
jgi:hypothetical protein